MDEPRGLELGTVARMERIWPADDPVPPIEAAPTAVAAHVSRPRVPPAGRPWVMTNMVASLDGAATRDGRSGGLGGPGDRTVFHALRELPDAILVGASTVRTERYRPPAPRPDGVRPRLAIVSGSLDLPTDLPCLADAPEDARPWVLTGVDHDPARADALADHAEVVVAGAEGTAGVDAWAALAALADRRVGLVLCEGGPQLLGELLAADLVDEWFLTVGGLVVGGDARRVATGTPPLDQRFRLSSVLRDTDDVLLAYVRARA